MISQQASTLWELFRNAPKQVDLPLPQRREAGEKAEGPTAEAPGVEYSAAPEVDGLWAAPGNPIDGAAVLYLFGGGYVLGSPASRRKTAGHIANAASMRVMIANYRLAPEHPFPAAIDDAVSAYRALLELGAQADRIVVMGDSAGGGLAAALLVALRDSGDPLPAGGVLISPWADLACTGSTIETCAGVDMMCSRDSLLEMAHMYLGSHDARDPLASPVYADLAGLPPILALVGGDEVLFDDAERLVRGVAMGGSDATLFVGGEMQHVWPIWAGAFPEADAAIALIGDWIRARTST